MIGAVVRHFAAARLVARCFAVVFRRSVKSQAKWEDLLHTCGRPKRPIFATAAASGRPEKRGLIWVYAAPGVPAAAPKWALPTSPGAISAGTVAFLAISMA
jgi:hypothetical protein